MADKQQFSIMMDRINYQALKALSIKRGVSMGAVVNEILRQSLPRLRGLETDFFQIEVRGVGPTQIYPRKDQTP